MEARINWYRTPLAKERLRQLTGSSDVRGLLQAGGFLAMYAATASVACWFFFRREWGPMVAACYLHSMLNCFQGMEAAVHELSHGTPFRTRWLNEFFYGLFSFLSWNNPVHFRASHVKHHQYTVHRGLDKEVVLEPIALTWRDTLGWFTFNWKKFKMIMFTNVAHALGRADRDFFFWDPLFEPGDPRRARMCNWARFLFVGHLALAAVFVYYHLWVLIYLVTFSYFFVNILGWGCGSLQHLGLTPNAPDWRITCHTVRFGPLLAFLYWQMQHHIEHHMYAAVPFYNLPRLRRAIEHDLPPRLPGFLAGLRKILAIQRRQKQDPAYVFVPEFPPTAAPPRFPESAPVNRPAEEGPDAAVRRGR